MPRQLSQIQHSGVTRRSSRPEALRRSSRLHVGWLFGVFVCSIAAVLCVMVSTAWFLGGRYQATTATVQELLPPEPAESSHSSRDSAESSTVSSAMHSTGSESSPVSEEAEPPLLPGAAQSADINEIPVENFSELKSMGWAIPYLNRRGYVPDHVETASAEGVRTIQVHFTDGQHRVNVAETRPEREDVALKPLGEKLTRYINGSAYEVSSVELHTGHEAHVFVTEDDHQWTAALETSGAQYVITSDLPSDSAAEISSWVVITDRSRLQLVPSSENVSDRLERGFEELASWLSR